MDQNLRNHLKAVFHLSVSTPNGLLYCSKRDGDLGNPKLEALASITPHKPGIALLNSLDPAIHALLKGTGRKATEPNKSDENAMAHIKLQKY
jgi:hypothetical protein